MEVALEAGAEDVVADEDGAIEVLTAPGRLRGREERAGSRRPEARSGRGHDAAREHDRAGRRGRRARCRSCSTCWKTWTTCRTSIHNARSTNDGTHASARHESPRHRRRRPRTRAGLEAGAVAASVQAVYVAPGNGGTALDRAAGERRRSPTSRQLRDWALKEKIALTVVGPEAPLAAGVVDEFRAHGLRVFGPTQAAAQLESSKAFSKAFMKRHGIPTAEYETFTDAGGGPRLRRRARARPSWSRPTAWRPARAWWWR